MTDPTTHFRRLMGDFLMVGVSESDDVDISNNKGSYDVWAVMINAEGEMLWEKSFGGEFN